MVMSLPYMRVAQLPFAYWPWLILVGKPRHSQGMTHVDLARRSPFAAMF
jgi:hypothetical protein